MTNEKKKPVPKKEELMEEQQSHPPVPTHEEACFCELICCSASAFFKCQSAQCCPRSHCKASSAPPSGSGGGIRQTFSVRRVGPAPGDFGTPVPVEFGEDFGQSAQWPGRVAVVVLGPGGSSSASEQLDLLPASAPGALQSPVYHLHKELPMWSLV